MGIVKVVAGGFYGSEGKGAIAAHLSRPDEFDNGIAIRVGGSNAGHTVVGPDGTRWPLRHIPVAAVVNPDARLALAAGSEIDLGVLGVEINQLENAGYKIRERLIVDPNATLVTGDHKRAEENTGLTGRLGSTAKGIGAARSERAWRTAPTVRDFADNGALKVYGIDDAMIQDVAVLAHTELNSLGGKVLIEGTQGYGLGVHTRFYPYTTSTDCRAVDFLAQAGVSPWEDVLEIYLVYRPNPIRVAGNSGPLEGETSWEALGLPTEQTTVTRNTRRVGVWDDQLAREAWQANGGRRNHGVVIPVIAMLDHQFPQIAGWTNKGADDLTAEQRGFLEDTVWPWTDRIEKTCFDGVEVALAGTGPDTVLDYR
jgi:adenylosuccinate synthase